MNRVFILGTLFVSAMLLGCGQPDEAEFVSLDRSDSLMVDILVGLHRVDATLFEESLDSVSQDSEGFSPRFKDRSKRDSVLAAHGQNEASFEAMTEVLLEQPDRFLMVYNAVLDRSSRN